MPEIEWAWHYLMGQPYNDVDWDVKRLCPTQPDECLYHMRHSHSTSWRSSKSWCTANNHS